MNPNEMPNTLWSHQQSINMEQPVMETPIHGVCVPLHRNPAVPIPADTSTCDIRVRLSGNTRLRLLHLLEVITSHLRMGNACRNHLIVTRGGKGSQEVPAVPPCS